MLKTNIKSLLSWDPDVGTPLIYKTPFTGADDILTHYTHGDFFFFLKPWNDVFLTCLIFFFFVLKGHKTVLKTMLLWSNSLSYLRGLSPGYNPHVRSKLFSILIYLICPWHFHCKIATNLVEITIRTETRTEE